MGTSSGRVLSIGSDVPRIHDSAWLADSATVVGNVTVGPDVGIFYGAVLRAEGASITVGAHSNIQDNCVVHAGWSHSVHIDEGVTVGHSAVLHGCTVESDVLVGMGAVLLNDCVIGTGSVIGAGALVAEGVVVPAGSLVVGSPGRVVRQVRPAEVEANQEGARHYRELLRLHRAAVAADARD